jgi:hypothetical protein
VTGGQVREQGRERLESNEQSDLKKRADTGRSTMEGGVS